MIARVLAGSILLAFLAACGGGAGGSQAPGNTISGIASKGPIKGGTVKVFALRPDGSRGDQLGTAPTGADGSYRADIGSYSGNIVVEVTGGSYRDEATGADDVPNPGLSATLTNVSGNVSVAVTPMTDIAMKLAGAALTSENIERANSLVSNMIGLNIINTRPADVSAAGGAASAGQDCIEYGLMLAALSRMVKDGNASDMNDAMSQIRDDLADGKLDHTGGKILAALENFINDSEYNKSGVNSTNVIRLDNAIEYIRGNVVSPPPDNSDLDKAKAMITGLRNTALSFYNYKGEGGIAGALETPFKNLAAEVETKLKPELTTVASRLGWVIGTAYMLQTETGETYEQNGLTLEIVPASINFTIKDDQGGTVGSGSVTVNKDNGTTSGTFAATFATPDGQLVATADYVASVTSEGALLGLTITGSITAPGFELDFSQDGRKLAVTFAQVEEESESAIPLPSNIFVSGRVKTATAQLTGSIDIPTLVQTPAFFLPLPKTITITGSFEELANGVPTGVKLNGMMTGTWNNMDTYDWDLGETPTNFPVWSATFEGKIAAPGHPTIEALLKVSQTEYKKIVLDLKYQRTNVDGTVVFYSGSVIIDESTKVLIATLTNQDGMIVNLTFDDSQPKDQQFTGVITSAGGVKQADLYTLNGIPAVKYIDNYFETII